jgi:hypothetical protein
MLPAVPPFAPSVSELVPVMVVPAIVDGVVAPTVPLNAPELNVPPVTVLPVNVSALGSESVGVVVPVTVISFAVPVMDVTPPAAAGFGVIHARKSVLLVIAPADATTVASG